MRYKYIGRGGVTIVEESRTRMTINHPSAGLLLKTLAEESWELSVEYLKPKESAVSAAAAAADVWECAFC